MRFHHTLLFAVGILLLSAFELPAAPGPKGPGGPGGGRPGGGGPPFGGGGFNPAGQVQQMANQQIQQLTGAFSRGDRNRDGRMTQPEFGNLFQSRPMQMLNKMMPRQNGNQQTQALNLFRQITGGRSSFDVNQLVSFASRMLQPGGQSQMQPKGGNPVQSLFQKLKRPPFKLPQLPFSDNAGTNSYSTNSAGTNSTASSTNTVSTLQLTLANALDQGYVTARYGSNRRKPGSTFLLIRVTPTEKASGKSLKLMLDAGATLIPKSRIYTPVRIRSFSASHPSIYKLGSSGDAGYWPISVSLLV